MLDRDLASLYGVETKILNKAVSRNLDRFPNDFMFQLNKEEFDLMFQNGTSSWGGTRKLPLVFTEFGIAMLSSVLRSEIALQVNISIMRVFGKLRALYANNEKLRHKIQDLESRQNRSEEDIQMLISAVNMILEPPIEEPKKIGFR